jgi:hypothetical protein
VSNIFALQVTDAASILVKLTQEMLELNEELEPPLSRIVLHLLIKDLDQALQDCLLDKILHSQPAKL